MLNYCGKVKSLYAYELICYNFLIFNAILYAFTP